MMPCLNREVQDAADDARTVSCRYGKKQYYLLKFWFALQKHYGRRQGKIIFPDEDSYFPHDNELEDGIFFPDENAIYFPDENGIFFPDANLSSDEECYECLGWLLNYVSSIGEHLPNEKQDRICSAENDTKEDVLRPWTKELGIASVPEKSKYRLWNKFCSMQKTTKGNSNNKVYFHMLPVGHTHEDVDAMFHNIADVLKVDVFTFPDLKSQIESISFIEKVKQIRNIWDVKKWLEPFIVGSHSFNDCFHIHVHYNKGKIVWHYKKWSKSPWFPDTNNSNRISEDMPRPVPPSWNSDLQVQPDFVGKKLIKSGLLTVEEEEKWWSDLSVAKIQGW
ncbi:unnamed protein product [Mytilus edulis]|uniref:DUF7869 domain-containing protein n=1 Tax=Mytilus edulis TaxID=6550 RepID=A0A8S3T118_MYTED|nr:unnamed protein product [Mytilus edulis]